MIRAFLAWLNPPEPPCPPIYERFHGLACGERGLAEGWVDVTHLARVLRAREEANRAGEDPLYRMEAPDSTVWCVWNRPAAPRLTLERKVKTA